MTVTDYCTKLAEAVPLKDKSAASVANVLTTVCVSNKYYVDNNVIITCLLQYSYSIDLDVHLLSSVTKVGGSL